MTLKIFSGLAEDNALLNNLGAFLRRSALLQNIELVFCWRHVRHVGLDSVLEDIQLPNLRSLSLANAQIQPKAFASFVQNHPLLTSLHLISGSYNLSMLPLGSFPALRSFGNPGTHRALLTDVARVGAPQLEELRLSSFFAEEASLYTYWKTHGKFPPALEPFRNSLKQVVISNDPAYSRVYPVLVAPCVTMAGGLHEDVVVTRNDD